LIEVALSINRTARTLDVPAAAIKTANRLWEVTDANELRAHEVEVLSRGSDRVAIRADGLSTGARVLVTDLPAPFEGQAVRVEEQDSPAKGAD